MSRTIPWPRHSATEIQDRRARLNAFLKSEETQVFRDRLPSDLAKLIDRLKDGAGEASSNTERAYKNDQRRYIAAAEAAGIDPLMPTFEFWTAYFEMYATEDIET